ncbi:MAG: hypothetical protein JKY31_13100 [Rhodobacteraceae bacterium]|nr:hypothetical protein [Paracoccaceae bacterium]
MYDMNNENIVVEMGIPVSVESCRLLWAAVLRSNWDQVFKASQSGDPRVRYIHRLDAQRSAEWFGSSGFCEVCALAGVDDEFVLDRFNAAYRQAGLAA